MKYFLGIIFLVIGIFMMTDLALKKDTKKILSKINKLK